MAGRCKRSVVIIAAFANVGQMHCSGLGSFHLEISNCLQLCKFCSLQHAGLHVWPAFVVLAVTEAETSEFKSPARGGGGSPYWRSLL